VIGLVETRTVSERERQSRKDQSGSRNRTLVEVKNLKKYFPITKGLIFERHVGDVRAVDGLNFEIKRGETLGLVGESGCGKTTAGRTILQLDRPTDGQVLFEGRDLAAMSSEELRAMRRRMMIIFQDPYASLDPRMKVGTIAAEPLRIHGVLHGKERKERVQELLRIVGLNPYFYNRYPHELSGGQRQRVGIARALALNPDFIVCDEPVSALDVSIQAQILNLLERLQEDFDLTYLFIAHDLSVVRHISDRVAVMYLGKIVELADWKEIYDNPLHPYTQALISAIPLPNPKLERQRERVILPGSVPSPSNPPAGCVFHTRCPRGQDGACSQSAPGLREIANGHRVACHQV
jgi:oligopeptide transport system ATP-binding protein